MCTKTREIDHYNSKYMQFCYDELHQFSSPKQYSIYSIINSNVFIIS